MDRIIKGDLQEENKELKERINKLEKRIDRAIGCIEVAKEFWITLKPDNSMIATKHFNKFLEILRGE